MPGYGIGDDNGFNDLAFLLMSFGCVVKNFYKDFLYEEFQFKVFLKWKECLSLNQGQKVAVW